MILFLLKDPVRHWNTPMTTLPDDMWNMLQHRCPDLRELTIDLSRACRYTFDPNPLLRCRWPNLRTLMIGDIWTLARTMSFAGWPVVRAFFAAHRDLVSFGSVSSQFEEHNYLPFLRHLQLTSVGQTTYSMTTLFRGLQMFSSLSSLSLWLGLGLTKRDFTPNLSDLFRSCPQISHLELFTCLSDPKFVSLFRFVSFNSSCSCQFHKNTRNTFWRLYPSCRR